MVGIPAIEQDAFEIDYRARMERLDWLTFYRGSLPCDSSLRYHDSFVFKKQGHPNPELLKELVRTLAKLIVDRQEWIRGLQESAKKFAQEFTYKNSNGDDVLRVELLEKPTLAWGDTARSTKGIACRQEWVKLNEEKNLQPPNPFLNVLPFPGPDVAQHFGQSPSAGSLIPDSANWSLTAIESECEKVVRSHLSCKQKQLWRLRVCRHCKKLFVAKGNAQQSHSSCIRSRLGQQKSNWQNEPENRDRKNAALRAKYQAKKLEQAEGLGRTSHPEATPESEHAAIS